MIDRRGLRLAFALLVLAPAPAGAAAGSSPATAANRIVYVAGATIYVDAGSTAGWHEGDTLSVSRDGGEIARLRVSALSSQRAGCDTLFTSARLKTGDAVRWQAGLSVPGTTAAAAPSSDGAAALAAATPKPARPRSWLRGRAGVRWLSVNAENAVRVEQPMLDLRLDGGSGDSPLAVGLDLRGRQTTRTSASGISESDAEARVYRAALVLRGDGGHRQFSAGRITSPALASVSLFDGGLAEAVGDRWRAGAFGGTQPEPTRMGWSSRVSEYGAYLEARSRGVPERLWRASGGAVSSYDRTRSDRDFLFAQADYRDRRVSGSLLQEADIVRPWKRRADEPGFALTSTFVNARSQVTPWFALQTGYDNRRNVRLWRDRVSPETEFDDRYRQGVWGGGSVRLPVGLGFSGDQRWNRDGGDATTVSSAGVEYLRRSWRSLALRGRWSEFRSTPSRSRLRSGSLGANPTPMLYLEVSGGRRETRLSGSGGREVVDWWGAASDVAIGRRWFLDASFEASRGGFEHTTQIYAGLARRL